MTDPTKELPLDCGDTSCLFSLDHGGMRTNGGCRCLGSWRVMHPNDRQALQRWAYAVREMANERNALLDEVERLKEWQRQMVAKAAANSLDGYRELGARAAAAENRADVLADELERSRSACDHWRKRFDEVSEDLESLAVKHTHEVERLRSKIGGRHGHD